jgi:PAS domain S-box-containing protein
LEDFRNSASLVLGRITTLALQIADDMEFHAALALDESLSATSGLEGTATGDTADILRMAKSAMNVRFHSSQLHSLILESLDAEDTALVNYRRSEFLAVIRSLETELDELQASNATREIEHLLLDLEIVGSHLFAARTEFLLLESGLSEALTDLQRQMNAMDNNALQVTRSMKVNADGKFQASARTAVRFQQIELALVLTAFGLAVTVGLVISRSVHNQIRSLMDGIRIVGEGDLQHKVDTETGDEIGELSRAFDDMTCKLARREREVVDSEQRFRRLFEESNDGIIIHDLRGSILDANRRMAQMVGYERKRFLAMNLQDLWLEEDLHVAQAALEGLVQAHTAMVESRYVKADGTVINVDIRSAVIDTEENLVQTVIRDITERKRAEEQLRQRMDETSEAYRRLEVMVENSTDREKRMVKLKQEVNDLLRTVGQNPKYHAPREVARLEFMGRAPGAETAEIDDTPDRGIPG